MANDPKKPAHTSGLFQAHTSDSKQIIQQLDDLIKQCNEIRKEGHPDTKYFEAKSKDLNRFKRELEGKNISPQQHTHINNVMKQTKSAIKDHHESLSNISKPRP